MIEDVLLFRVREDMRTIKADARSFDWALDPMRARPGMHVVFCNWDRTAVMVSKITTLEPFSDNPSKRNVVLHNFAHVHVQGIYPMHRAALRYSSRARLREQGLDIDSLTFQPLPFALVPEQAPVVEQPMVDVPRP